MENFFDVATPEEIREFYDDGDDEELTEEFIDNSRRMLEESSDSNCAYLFMLYYLYRKDQEKAFYYLNKIQNNSYKETTYRAICCPDVIDI